MGPGGSANGLIRRRAFRLGRLRRDCVPSPGSRARLVPRRERRADDGRGGEGGGGAVRPRALRRAPTTLRRALRRAYAEKRLNFASRPPRQRAGRSARCSSPRRVRRDGGRRRRPAPARAFFETVTTRRLRRTIPRRTRATRAATVTVSMEDLEKSPGAGSSGRRLRSLEAGRRGCWRRRRRRRRSARFEGTSSPALDRRTDPARERRKRRRRLTSQRKSQQCV